MITKSINQPGLSIVTLGTVTTGHNENRNTGGSFLVNAQVEYQNMQLN